MESKERLINLKEILKDQYQLVSTIVKELGRAKALSDSVDALRYNHQYDRKFEEFKKLEDQISHIEQKLEKNDYSIDERIKNIEFAHFSDIVECLSEWKEMHKELHEVLEPILRVSSNLTLLRRQVIDERLDQKTICDLQQDWEKSDPILKKSCTIMEDFQNLKHVSVVQNYQIFMKKNRDEFANALSNFQWSKLDEENGKVQEQINNLKNICTQFESEIYSSMSFADRQIIKIIENLRLHIKNKGGIEL